SSALSSALCLLFRLPAASTLFPYTTLFRSDLGVAGIVIIEVDGIVIGILGGPSGTAAGGCLGGRFGSRRGFSGRFTRSGLACSRSEEHTSELQSRENLVCRLLLEKKKKKTS